MSLKEELINIAKSAKEASREMAAVSAETKNAVLKEMARALLAKKAQILKANKRDLSLAKSQGLSAVMLDRLSLNEDRIQDMAISLNELTKLKDPVGEVIKSWARPNGLKIKKVRAPIGVIAIIYESRPNVTAECIGLCFKSGNALILRGGSEALNSNLEIYRVLRGVLQKHKLPLAAVNLISTRERKAVDILLKLNEYIDVVIPRGGEGLIKKVVKVSLIAVIKHYKGICHVYVDEWADLNMAEKICFNAKVGRPGVCNAMESMLVHKDAAMRFLPGMIRKFKLAGVEIRGCPITRKIIKSGIKPATEKDYFTEYLDLILSVKVVDNLQEAIKHINFYGSHHSDAIVTDDEKNAREFLQMVDSACVYVNASTRFTDGYQFGMGAEIGISTDKLHARG
ncbi:MAG: glutamate-5-semialdehyde dehydrogenase, partial [Candidatus Omnitrophica bacterium]|nr:glutamate-5-semialdehyde dehydrogenase [Candidatus Omnitrophota bacterium]